MKAKAFTLIELLVVVFILGVLMAILLPTLNRVRNQGQRVACQANLSGYGLAITMYLDDNDGRFVDPRSCYFSQMSPFPVETRLNKPWHVRWCNRHVYLREHPQYAGPFYHYFQSAGSYICPTFFRQAFHDRRDPLQAEVRSVKSFLPWYNYTMNAYLGTPVPLLRRSRVLKQSQVRNPSETFSFTEESTVFDPAYSRTGLNDTHMLVGRDGDIQQWLSQAGDHRLVRAGPDGVGAMRNVIAGIHDVPTGRSLAGKGNCVFLDGHVSPHSREDTFLLAWPH